MQDTIPWTQAAALQLEQLISWLWLWIQDDAGWDDACSPAHGLALELLGLPLLSNVSCDQAQQASHQLA